MNSPSQHVYCTAHLDLWHILKRRNERKFAVKTPNKILSLSRNFNMAKCTTSYVAHTFIVFHGRKPSKLLLLLPRQKIPGKYRISTSKFSTCYSMLKIYFIMYTNKYHWHKHTRTRTHARLLFLPPFAFTQSMTWYDKWICCTFPSFIMSLCMQM